MSTDSSELISLGRDSIKPASMMLARAFQEDALDIYAYPDASEREKRLPYTFEFVLRYGLYYGIKCRHNNLEEIAYFEVKTSEIKKKKKKRVRGGKRRGFLQDIRSSSEPNPQQRVAYMNGIILSSCC